MTVEIGVHAERSYVVHLGAGVSDLLPAQVDGCQRVAILHPHALADAARAAGALLSQEVTFIELPDAEAAKTVSVASHCWDALAEAGHTRSDAVVGLGGGATTDLAGFVAATWLRGVRYVSVPTTVLAMVDAAVGGKTGINIDAGKNLVGAFYEPAAVLCDTRYLATLPTAEIRAGLAEVIKAGFIADPAILDLVEANPGASVDPGSEVLADLLARAIRVKADVVTRDLREATSVGDAVGRELLNYGHTLGHAIERHEHYRMRHGAAISIGMMFAAELARELKLMPQDLVDRHRSILTLMGLPSTYRASAWPYLRSAMNLDKKTRGAALRLVLLRDLTEATIVKGPDEHALANAFARIAED